MIRKLEESRVCLVDGNLKRLALAPALDPDLKSGLGLVRLVPQGAHIGPVADGLRYFTVMLYQPIRYLTCWSLPSDD